MNLIVSGAYLMLMKRVIFAQFVAFMGSVGLFAQTWSEPQVPGTDLTSLSSETFVYVYNVEANSFISYGMEWGTNACCTRLTNGESAASIPQRCYAFVDDGKVSIQMVDKAGNYVSCLSDGLNNVYVDQDQNRQFTFAETASGSTVYTLTNTTYSLPLDVFWDRGGHLTLASGKGHTKWAFIKEEQITDGSFAKYRAKVALYNVYQAIVDAGKTSTYSSQISTASSTYTNSGATVAQLKSAASTLFKAAAADLSGDLDVSFLYDNADMAATGNNESWTDTEKNVSWGEFEQYHAQITLTQTQTTVPQGIYDVSFRALYRQDGTDASPTLTAAASNTIVADVPDLSDMYFDVANANNNGWTTGENYVKPNNMQSAGQALMHPDAQALAHNVVVGSDKQLTITAQMTSTSQWLNWQNFEVVYRGNDITPLKAELQTVIQQADAVYNSSYNGAATFKTVLDNAKAVYNNSGSTAVQVNEARVNLEQAIETFLYVSATVDHPLDYSDKVKNPSFEDGLNKWENSGMQTQTNSAFTGKDGNTYVEKWVGAGNAVGDGYVRQTITGLEMGKFVIKAQAQNLQEGSSNTQHNAWIFGNIDKVEVGANGEYTLVWVNIEENPTIGFLAEGATGNWIGVDNFRLYYAGGELSDYKTELQKYIDDAQGLLDSKMENSARSTLQTAITNAQNGLSASTADNYPSLVSALKAAKATANTSINAFAELQNAINTAETRYGSGNMTGADTFLAAINQAKAVNNNLDSTQDQMAAEIKNLEKAYLRYMVTNGSGTAPTVVTDTRYVRGAIEAFGRMTVSGVSDSDILEQGFCYSTEPNPTVFDNCATGYLDWGGKIYRMPMQPATIYYMRPYAITNTYAVGYGDVIKMSTLPMGNVTYTYYNNDGGDFHYNKNTTALTEACTYWSNYTSINGFHVTANYSSGTPTADCGYGGGMRIGSNTGQRTGTIMHEMNHGVGCGTLGIWGGWEDSFLRTSMNGDWAGERANAALRFWENRNDLVICGAYDNAHWGFRPFDGVYEDGGGGTAIWENKYAFNGAHLEPYAWAGPQDWNGTQAVFIGNSIIIQGMMEDGLIPVNAWSGGFCLPAYVFVQYDDQKYYIKCEDENRGFLDSFLIENNDGTLSWSTAKNERTEWYVTFNPATQYYQLRNASTGHYIRFNDGGTNGFKANGSNATDNQQQFHLIRGRNDIKIDGNTFGDGMRAYWLMTVNDGSAPRALTADANGATSANPVNLWDSGTTQRWAFVPIDQMDEFEEGVIGVDLAELRRYLNGYTTAKNVAHADKVTGATTALNNTINTIETAIAGTVTLEQVTQYLDDIKSAGLTFLNNTKPTSTPYDITFLIDNPDFTNSTNGWSLTPTRNYGAIEFYQTTFDFYQILPDMPSGTYQLTADAFQRPGANADVYTAYTGGTDNVNAVIYVNSSSQKIKNVMSGAQSASISSGEYETEGETFVPNDMQSGSVYLTSNYYGNTLEGEFAEGDLRIGLRGTVSNNGYWTMADNFKLYYLGTDEVVVSLKQQLAENGFTKITELPNDYSPYFFVLYDHDQDLTMVLKNPNYQGGSKSMWYDADYNPMTSKEPLWTMDSYTQDDTEYQILTNATYADIMLQTEGGRAWHYRCSDNGGGGTGWGRTKYEYINDGYWTIQNGVYPDAGYLGPWDEIFEDDAETALNKTGNNIGHFDVFTILRGDYVKRFDAWADADYDNPLDITYVLENPGGERRTTIGWKSTGATWQGQGNSPSGKVGGYYLESYHSSGIGDSDFYQEISGLPDGYYRFSARGLVRDGGDQGFSIYANSESTPVTSADLNTVFNVVVQVLDGNLRVGAIAESVTKDWIAIDDVMLEYLGLEIPGYNVGLPTPSIADGSYQQSLRSVSLNFTEATTNVEGAVFNILDNTKKIALYKDGTKVGDYTINFYGKTVSADLSGITLDTEATYRIDLPAGTVGYAGQVSNEAYSITFHTPAIFDGTYYLYNTYTESYLSRGGTWATACILDDWGLAMKLATDEEGRTTLKYFDSQAYLFDSGFCWADGGTGLNFTVSKTGTNYKFLNQANNRYLAVFNGRAVGDAEEGGNLVGTSNIWMLETTEAHVANYARNENAQAATAATEAGYTGITTKTALDNYLADNARFEEIEITGAKAERYNWYAAQAETLTESEYYKETVSDLTPGLYRLTVDAFQRAGLFEDVDAADGARGCIYLYANDAKTQLKSVMEYGSTTRYADTDYQSNGLYYPNRENPGYTALETGNYQNTVYVYVEADEGEETGTLTFGINNPNRLGNNISKGTWAVFENFNLELVVERMTLSETDAVAPPTTKHVDVTLNRTVKANTWNTICLPFNLTESQFKTAFGENVQVMRLTGTTTKNETVNLVFETADEIEANIPYILKTDQAGTSYAFNAIDVTPSEDLTDAVDGIQFIGNYIYPKVLDNDGGQDYYITNNQFKSSPGATKLKGYRAYFHVPEGLNIKAIGFDFDEPTGIINIADGEMEPTDIYTVSGILVRRQATSMKDLPNGIYVMNGKKVIKWR